MNIWYTLHALSQCGIMEKFAFLCKETTRCSNLFFFFIERKKTSQKQHNWCIYYMILLTLYPCSNLQILLLVSYFLFSQVDSSDFEFYEYLLTFTRDSFMKRNYNNIKLTIMSTNIH